MRKLKRFFKWLLGLIVVLVALAYLTDYEYVLKGARVVYLTGHTTAFIDDHGYFENDTIAPSPQPQSWPMHVHYNAVPATPLLTQTNEELGTVAFLIIKNDSLWFEYYAENYGPASQTNSFSMAKSVTSALMGKAIMDGYLSGLDHKVGDFFEEYYDTDLTVGDLSSMASGLDWNESYTSPFAVTARAYYDDDLAETILNQKVIDEPGVAFRYLSGNTQLLAMTIEKATGKNLNEYLKESFWDPMGFEKPALWQVDDSDNRLTKAYCCIGSNARDFARFGKLYQDHGKWNGKQLLDSAFVAKSVVPRFEASPEYGYGFWLSDHMDKHIFVMRGILGQYVINIPEDDIIIVRLGHNRGNRTDRKFADDFFVYIEEAYKMLNMN